MRAGSVCFFTIVFLVLHITTSYCQRIVDPCFNSIQPPGKFVGSKDVVNACPGCPDPFEASDIMEWNGTFWEGAVFANDMDLAPPPGCNTRAVWLGYNFWTVGGEAIALRLDTGLIPGTEYQYTFTYASEGSGSNEDFSPRIYTNSSPDAVTAQYVGRLPSTNGWTSNTLTFTAQPAQAGHTWLFLHAFESSGMVLGQCNLTELYPPGFSLLGDDKTFCDGETLELVPPINANFEYTWSDNSENSVLTVSNPGEYAVKIQYGGCEASDTVVVAIENCKVVLIMPNVFTPNNDTYNETFVPKEHNFIRQGTTRIYNRWGNEIFTGDLFEGWNGRVGSSEASSGIYYYRVDFTDERQRRHFISGYVTVML